jgi:hypothetical protein
MKESSLGSGDYITIIRLSKKFKVSNNIDAIVSTSSSLYHSDDDFYDEPIKTKYLKGDTIAILDNPGGTGDESVLEIVAEIKFTKDTIVYTDGISGEEINTVCIPVGDDKFVSCLGEYFIIDGDDLAKINSDLNKNYKIAFASPC